MSLQRNIDSDRPTCVLRSYIIDKKPYPSYTALSYVWGENVRYDDVLLNGRLFPVARNLWSFLRQMNQNEDFITLFWIDAICIDQTNMQERNHQVQMMRQIYSNAELVLVWLGETDEKEYGHVAMDYLVKRKPLQTEGGALKEFWRPWQSEALIALCERQYWTRVWIVQELLLARDLIIHCGPRAMSWYHLQRFFEDIAVVAQHGRGQHTRVSFVGATPAANIVQVKAGWGDQNSRSLVKLIRLFRDQKATDIRDNVYALHGLASDTGNMTINYELSTWQLLVVVLRHTCVSLGTGIEVRKSRRQLLKLGRELRDILKVSCLDQEIDVIIIAEECRMTVADDVRAALEVRSKARRARDAVMSKARLERPWAVPSAPRGSESRGVLAQVSAGEVEKHEMLSH
jgi:hypothetical protein